MKSGQRLWPVLISTAIGFAILCSLGFWQLERLAWKQALIAAVDQQIAAAPTPLTAKMLTDGSATGIAEYQRFSVDGRYAPATPLRMIASLSGGPGWRLLHLFETADGARLLVDRGIAGDKQDAAAPIGEVRISGLVRHHSQGQGIFDPENAAGSNAWYWWDWPRMLESLPPSPLPTANFVLELLPGEPGTEGLFVAPPKAALANNHLGYAITWFGLAAALLGVAAAFIWGRMKKSAA